MSFHLPLPVANVRIENSMSRLQRAALGRTQGFVKSLLQSSTGRWAMIQLLCSQAKEKLQEELLKRNKHNLYVRPSAARCTSSSCINYDHIIENRQVNSYLSCAVPIRGVTPGTPTLPGISAPQGVFIPGNNYRMVSQHRS